MILWGSNVGRVFKCDPWMPGFKEHGQHFSPQLHGVDLAMLLQVTRFGHLFIRDVFLFKGFAVQIVQVGDFIRAEQGPGSLFHDALHKQVGDPVGRVHVVCAAAVITRVFAQFHKVFNIQVPGFQIGAYCPFAFSALVDGNGCVVHDFQKWNDALASAICATDIGICRAHIGPVIAQTARPFGQFGIVGYHFEYVFQVILCG